MADPNRKDVEGRLQLVYGLSMLWIPVASLLAGVAMHAALALFGLGR